MTNDAEFSEAEFLVRARAIADSGDQHQAVELCRQYLAASPNAPGVARLAVQIMIGSGQGPQAVELCQDIAIALPDATWPFGQACEPLAIALADLPAECQTAKDMVADSGTDAWAAMQTVRRLLQAATWWPQLVKQLQLMSERTWLIKEQISLNDQLINVLAQKLSDPVTARDAREAAEQWKDVPTMVQGYWTALEEHSLDPAAWDETERFFRVNELWADLAKLLEASLDGATEAERVALWTEIVALQEKVPHPEWDVLDAKLAGDDRPDGPPFIRELRAQIKARQAAISLARRKTEKAQEGHFSMPIWLIGGVAITIGVVIATVIVIKLLG